VARNEIPPDTLLGGKIRLIKRIGRGGMGDVWVARNEATQAELAVKTLQRSERTPLHDERFRREARLSATISHRNVVRVFDLVDEADGTLGLVMELLRGGTLEDLMRERGPLSSQHAIAVALPVLSAMHHVHQKGIIHRDVKPANVFFAVEPDGHLIPKVLDFGIAKLPAAGSALTMDGSVLGTPHYMSPEQIRGQEDIDGRSDMFSFAVVLYEMLTGVRVFQRDTASASLAAVLEHEVDPDPRIEPRLWIAISRALAKRPYERYASCAELAEALRSAVDATDDDLAQALQELRPKGTEAPSTTAPSSISMASRSSVSRDADGLPKRKGMTTLVAIFAAACAAIFAVGLTLVLTQKSEPKGDVASAVGSGGTNAASHPPGATPAGREIPPVDTVTSAEVSLTPVSTSASKEHDPPVVKAATTTTRRSEIKKSGGGGGNTTRPRGSASVATTPGF